MPTSAPALRQHRHGPERVPSHPARPAGLVLSQLRRAVVISVGVWAAVMAGQAAAQTVKAPNPGPLVEELLRRGQAADALSTVNAALASQPRDAALRFLRGVALMDLQQDAQAVEVFTALAEEYPELPDPWNNLALLHVRAGQPDLARRALEVALRNDPSHRTARLNLGEVYLLLAAQSWQQAAQLAPLEPAQTRRLAAVRELLSTPVPGR
jgi:tetratricopeptide (TPR) repeat protein